MKLSACLLMVVVLALGDRAFADEAAGVTAPATATGAPAVVSKPRGTRTKPEAPIDIRWLADGRNGDVVLEIVSGIDHVGAVVRLTAPGLGTPRVARLPAAKAGELQTVEWQLGQPATRPPKVFIEVDTGEGRIARNAVASWSGGKKGRAAGEFESRPEETPRAPKAAGAGTDQVNGDRLAILPAEQTIRREND
jgi:hypothetical protein